MADRYAYLPIIGLSIILSWGLDYLLNKFNTIKVHGLLICLIIIPLIILTTIQLRYWQNGILLFEHAVKLDNNNFLAQNNLGFALAVAGKEKEAIGHYYVALGMKEIEHEAHYNLGKAFQSLGQFDKAIYHYKSALQIKPDYFNASMNLGAIFISQQKYDEAIHYFLDALKVNPNHTGAYNNLGVIMALQKREAQAIYYFNMASIIDPANKMTILNLNRLHRDIKKGTDLMPSQSH